MDELPYPGTCRGSPLKDAKTQIAIRFELPDIATVNFVDALQGSQSDDVRRTSGDFVLRRRDGIYAYHLAVVVDDAAQGITEVVRGADLLSSTGRHILLQQALGVPTPRYCHLPLALDGRDLKLSKSSQSLAVDPKQASPLLWRALASLRQTPPPSLQAASLAEIWAWAVENWSLDPLQGLLSCPAPAAGLAITSG